MAVDLLSQSLFQGVSLLWEKGQLTDVTLRCENQTFQAHRLVLAAHSSHLHHILTTESTDPVATLDMDQFNLSADSLQILLHYLYTGNIVVTEDSHRMLQTVATTLNIKCLLTLLEAAKSEFVEQIPVVDAKGGEDMSPNVVAKGGEDVEIKEETESTGSLRPEADSGSVRESVDNVSGASKTADNTAESLPQPSVSQYHVEAKVQVIIPEATLPVKRKRGRPPRSATAKSPTVKLTIAKAATPKSAKVKLATPKRTPKKTKKGESEEDPEFIPETIGTVTLKKRKKVEKAKAKRGIRARKGKAETADDLGQDPSELRDSQASQGDKPISIYMCETCGKVLKSRQGVEDHLVAAHGEEPRHRCEVCNKGFQSATTLKSHRLGHINVKGYHCVLCKKQYTYKKNLTEHMVMTHGEGVKQSCPECGKGISASNLSQHRESHRPKLRCEVCYAHVSNKANLLRHLRTVHLIDRPISDTS